jgi:hypothetical protein
MSSLAMKTWANVLEEAYRMAAAANPGSRTEWIRNGISMGVEMTDATLMTKEFAVRLQLVSLLKNSQSLSGVEISTKQLTHHSSKFQTIRNRKRRSKER